MWDIRRFGALHILDHYATTPVRVRRQQGQQAQQQRQQPEHACNVTRASPHDPTPGPHLSLLSRSLSAGSSGARRDGTGGLQSEEDAVEAAWASLALHTSKQGLSQHLRPTCFLSSAHQGMLSSVVAPLCVALSCQHSQLIGLNISISISKHLAQTHCSFHDLRLLSCHSSDLLRPTLPHPCLTASLGPRSASKPSSSKHPSLDLPLSKPSKRPSLDLSTLSRPSKRPSLDLPVSKPSKRLSLEQGPSRPRHQGTDEHSQGPATAPASQQLSRWPAVGSSSASSVDAPHAGGAAHPSVRDHQRQLQQQQQQYAQQAQQEQRELIEQRQLQRYWALLRSSGSSSLNVGPLAPLPLQVRSSVVFQGGKWTSPVLPACSRGVPEPQASGSHEAELTLQCCRTIAYRRTSVALPAEA